MYKYIYLFNIINISFVNLLSKMVIVSKNCSAGIWFSCAKFQVSKRNLKIALKRNILNVNLNSSLTAWQNLNLDCNFKPGPV